MIQDVGACLHPVEVEQVLDGVDEEIEGMELDLLTGPTLPEENDMKIEVCHLLQKE